MASRRPNESEYAAAFGAALNDQLSKRQMRQSDLARATGVTSTYINRLASGYASPSPEWVDLIADTLKLQKRERGRLHAAAARSRGYRIDLLDE